MPIKFRCKQCRQFLGISRSMAGKLVDCPTCGRTVRVPHLDGRVDPLPKPELNLADSQLAQALDELAMIGESPAEDSEPPPEPEKTPPPNGVIEPTPLPEPVPIEPPLPAVQVSKAGSPSLPSLSAAAEANQSGTAPDSQARSQDAAVEPAPTSASHEGELAGLAASAFDQHAGRPGRRFAGLWQSVLSTPVLLILGGTAVVMFGLGYLAGRNGRSGDAVTVEDPAGGEQTNAISNGAENGTPAAGPSNATRPAAVKGRISYKNGSGDSRPDRGARVILFPQTRTGEAKLSIVGFRAGDADSDFEVAQAGLRALGGAVAVVDEDGNFEISLSGAGLYHILVLSHYQPRDEAEPIEPALKTLLDSYFDRPEQLLGRVGYHFSQVRYKGEGTELWDHSFERAL